MGTSTEIADQIGSQSIWSPFAVGNITIRIDIQTISFPPPTEFFQTTLGFLNCLDPFLSLTVPATKSIFERGQPRIQLYNTYVGSTSLLHQSNILTCAVGRNRIGPRLSHYRIFGFIIYPHFIKELSTTSSNDEGR